MQTILRRLSLLLALLVVLAGCAAAEAVPDPREEVADASAVETALDISFGAPEGVEAVYIVIDGSTGEAAFTVGELECTLRAARTAGRHLRPLHGDERAHRGGARRWGKTPFPSLTAPRKRTAAMTSTPGSWTTCSIAWYSTAMASAMTAGGSSRGRAHRLRCGADE